MPRVWVYAECVEGKPRPVVLELLTGARRLGELEAVALGPGASEAAETLGKYGAKKIYVHEDPAFRDQLATPAVKLLAALVEKHRPDLLLFGMTYDGRDIASRLSGRMGTALIANVTGVERKGESWAVTSPIFGGSLLVTTVPRGKQPAVVLVKPKAFAAETAADGGASVERLSDAVDTAAPAPRIVERKLENASGPRLEDAPIIVSGGRGLGAPENFKLLDDLAAELGAAVGASRAVVDAGRKPYSFQIGQTGKTVKPGVYLAFGISGAMQHTVGMKGAKTIIAVNKDPEAPIFKLADLGVVGDVHKILPQLTAEVRARKGK
jgi:electron transfer flavoprotein alpha subunit